MAITRFNLRIVTPYRDFYNGEITSCVIPTTDGDIGFMAGHSPVVVALKPGVASYRIDDDIVYYAVSEGFAEVSRTEVVIVCNSAELPQDLHMKRICKAYKASVDDRAEAMKIEDEYMRKVALLSVDEDLERAKARRHLIEMYGSDEQKERLARYVEEFAWK